MKKNNVYARHLLVSRRHAPTESISEFLQAMKGLAKECSFDDVSAAVYREELTRDSFINNLSSSSIRQRLLEKDNLTLVQAYELADSIDRAQRQSQHMNQVVGHTMTAASTAPLEGPPGDCDVALDGLSVATARTQSSSPHNKEVVRQSCCHCGLHQHKSRLMCPAHEAICHACGKRGHYSRVCRTKSSSQSINKSSASAVFSETRPVLASAPPSLESAVIKGSLKGSPVEVLIDSGASENFIDDKVASRLNLPVKTESVSIGMASSEVSVHTIGKVTGVLELLGRSYSDSTFKVLREFCADVIVGQEFLKRHTSVTFVMNEPEDPLTIGTPSTTTSAQLSVAAPKLDPPR